MTKRKIIADSLLAVIAVSLFSFIVSFTYAFQIERHYSTAPTIAPEAISTAALAAVENPPRHVHTDVRDLPRPLTTASTSVVSATTTLVAEESATVKEPPVVNTKKPQPVTVTTKPVHVTKNIQSPEVVTKSIESPVVVTPPVQKVSVSDAQFAAAVVSHIEEQTNDYRIKSDLQALKPDDVLQKIAESYSATMLENNFFSHADKNGCDVNCRLESHEYKAFSWGENLAQIKFSQTPTALEVATSFMQGWKKSAGHRKNLLSAKFTHQGVGVAVSKNAVYVTVNFSEPKK